MRYIVRSSKKYRFRGRKTRIYKVCSLPVICNYEDTKNNQVHFSAHLLIYKKTYTNNNEVHFSPRSVIIGIQKDTDNNYDEKINTSIVGIFALGHNYQ